MESAAPVPEALEGMCTPMSACASTTESFVPSPQKSTRAPRASRARIYLAAGRKLASVMSAKNEERGCDALNRGWVVAAEGRYLNIALSKRSQEGGDLKTDGLKPQRPRAAPRHQP